MEQTLSYTSPYRNKFSEKEKQIPGFVKRFLKQTGICIIILPFLLIANNIETVRTSSIWQNMIYLIRYDINVNEACETFSRAWNYIKIKTNEYNINEEAEPETNEKEQMQSDVESIKSRTKVLRPVAGIATSRFGKRINENGIEELHGGVDLEAQIGTPVKAAISGKVIEVKELETSFGKYLKIQNEDIVTTYAHCSSIEVKLGDEINQGEVIAYSGNSGNVTGPHLHFEITKEGRYVDPGFLLTYE